MPQKNLHDMKGYLALIQSDVILSKPKITFYEAIKCYKVVFVAFN